MTTIDERLSGDQTRAFDLSAAQVEGHTITGIGVPFETETEIWPGFFESFARGSVTDDGAILCYGHAEGIGRITEATDADGGRQITATISETQRGADVLTLVRDGVLSKLSIRFRGGDFEQTEREDGTHIKWLSARAFEYSVVEIPAYPTAAITDVRTAHTTPKENTMPPADPTPTPEASGVDELRAQVTDLERRLTLAQAHQEPAPIADTRSIGQALKDLARGDEATLTTIAPYMSRAYEGGVIADDGRIATPVWIKDLSRIIDNANPIAALFSKDTLPSEGMSIEYTQLKSNTTQVGKQAKEGDDLVKGKVQTETKNATVETFGGANTMSFQEIQRSRTNMVTLTTKAMAIAAGKQAAASFHTFYEAQVAARTTAITISKALATITWADLLAMILDVNKAYRDLGMTVTGGIVNRETFLALGSLTGSDGRPLMSVNGTGANTVGTFSAELFKGQLGNITFVPDFDQTANIGEGVNGTFFNADALRVYTSGIGHLQDDNILNLTRDMSVYYFAAHAAEIPDALIPLKIGA